jgi:hypothetical protein
LKIVNCLEEWQTGAFVMIPFSGDRYETVYQDLASLINATDEHPYHGRKLRKLSKSIAIEGQYGLILFFFIPTYTCIVFFYHRKLAPRNRGNPGSRGFKVVLD